MTTQAPSRAERDLVVFGLLAVFATLLVRTAWIADDAAITLRSVLNFVHGYGPTFNLDERVQAYTHPLWFLLVSAVALPIGNVYAAVLITAILLSLGVVWWIARYIAVDRNQALLALAVLLLSKAFVDYSTSGLENPLAHLLLVVLARYAYDVTEGSGPASDRQLLRFFGVAGLVYLTRADLVLIVVPIALLVALHARGRPRRWLRILFLAGLPVLVWTAFSLFYYGFPFPNTAYAKLGVGLPLGERLVQGGRYFLDSLDRDPLTLAVIATGLALGFFSRAADRALAVGVLLYLAYVTSIGGDFMSGRFFTAPLVLAVVLLARRKCTSREQWGLVALFGLLAANSFGATVLSGADYSNKAVNAWGIADERGFYFEEYGLISTSRDAFEAPEWRAETKQVVVITAPLGHPGIEAGPGTHIVDRYALADPLLARLPAKANEKWRIGHFERQLPTDYVETLRRDVNVLADPATREFYASLRTITRGPLFSWKRAKEIVRMNLGLVPRPNARAYRHGVIPEVTENKVVALEDVPARYRPGPWDQPENLLIRRSLEVRLREPRHIRAIEASFDHNDRYDVEIDVGGKFVDLCSFGPVGGRTGLARYRHVLGTPSRSTTRLRITPREGDGFYSLGHLVLH